MAHETTQRQLALAIADAMRVAATANGGSAWESQVESAPADDAGEGAREPITAAVRLRGGIAGEVYLCVSPEGAGVLLATVDGTAPTEVPAAWLDLVKSSLTQLGPALSRTFGDTQVSDCQLKARTRDTTSLSHITLRAAEGMNGTVLVAVDEVLERSLAQVASRGDGGGAASAEEGRSIGEGRRKIDRVIDVSLAVTLRFGQRQLTLRELLELSTGSLVELDRQVEEPVDLMLGDRIIARGEVVIVDGNYGMRVTEVVESPTRRDLRQVTLPAHA